MTFTSRILLLPFLFALVIVSNAQTTISAGLDTTICLGGTASLHAEVTGGGFGTDSYTFEVYPYSPEAYSGGTGVVFGNPSSSNNSQDDKIAGPFDIGFPFCFFNQTYTQFYIGSNGWVGFTYNAGWTTFTSQPIPNANSNCPKNCIMAPWEDWWPAFPSGTEPGVFYYVTGTPPNRKLVVYWSNSSQYGCRNNSSAPKGSFQIVLNEQTSVIENHLTLKPQCGSQTATQGVHNLTGTVAFTATGRNSTLWNTSNESTRFVPSGIKWYTGGFPGGTIVGYGTSLNIATTATTIYTAVVETCGGVYATDDITVTVKDPEFSFPQYSYCKDAQNPVPTILQPGGTFTSSPSGLSISSTTGEIDIPGSAPGTYTITYTINTPCTVSKNRTLSIWPLPVPVIAGNASLCPDPQEYLFITESGMTNYQWNFSPDGTVTQGGTSASDNIKLKWNTPGPKTILVNYTTSHGCTALSPSEKSVTVNPVTEPYINGPLTACQDQIITYRALSGMSNYAWTVSSAGNIISGGGVNDSVIAIKWITPGSGSISLNFTNPNGCRAVLPATASIEIRPVPYMTSSNYSVCSGSSTSIPLTAAVPGSSFSWTCTSGSGGLAGYSAGSGDTIRQFLFNNNYLPKWVVYHITAAANGCIAPVINDTVTIRPSPAVRMSVCIDTVTNTGSLPLKLKGAEPIGGAYTGTGVSADIFYPSTAGTGRHVIDYIYVNNWICSDKKSITINVLDKPVFICGDTLTDLRDGKKYRTIQIGAQCWMASNLNFGGMINSGTSQRENCVFEKYCINNLSSNCSSYGGLYEWNEMMDYSSSEGEKGICPPSWHIPTEAEWNILFTNFTSSGFAGSPLKITGFSGFNALLTGLESSNKTIFWFTTFADIYWSSTSHGTYKAWAHGMNMKSPSVSYYPSKRNNGFYVRCVKD